VQKSLHPFFLSLFSLLCALQIALPSAYAQSKEMEPNEALQKVFEVLSAKKQDPKDSISCDLLLNNGAWESLAYIDMNISFNLTLEDVKEAVPDYYQFKKGKLYFKLINPTNHNEYGYSGSVQYKQDGSAVRLFDPKSELQMDKWEIRYVDENYLALDMDNLRVFFSHIKPIY
jgi:hypothetical protein